MLDADDPLDPADTGSEFSIDPPGSAEHDRGLARERWKNYKAQGIEPQRHDLQLAPQDG